MKNESLKRHLRNLTYSAVCLALAQLLPMVTGNIPEIGNMLCPMHIPVLLCGFLCGAPWGTLVGAAAPILRSLIFTRPVLYPTALAMMFELATYGFLAGLLYRLLPKKPGYVYISLIGAMLGGRVIGGLAQLVLLSLNDKGMTGAYFFAEYFVNAWPGIVLQIILIPLVVIALRRSKLMRGR